MYELGFENNPFGAENCMSSKSENLKLLEPFERTYMTLKIDLKLLVDVRINV